MKEIERENALIRRYEKLLNLSMQLNPVDISGEATIQYLENIGNGKKLAKDFILLKEMIKSGFNPSNKFVYKGRTFKDILKMFDRVNHALEMGVEKD